jgi:hypothetical protein
MLVTKMSKIDKRHFIENLRTTEHILFECNICENDCDLEWKIVNYILFMLSQSWDRGIVKQYILMY